MAGKVIAFKSRLVDGSTLTFPTFQPAKLLIIDCLVTPNLLASRSRDSIIQVGKSTFPRLCACKTRLAFDKSNEAVMSEFSSNCCSKSLAFIHRRPMFIANNTNNQITRFIYGFAGISKSIGSFQSACASIKSTPCFSMRTILSLASLGHPTFFLKKSLK